MKFNSREEDVVGETYLGTQILQFYFKCSRCFAELTMKTDPQNSGYTMESAATQNYEPWRATDEAVYAAKSKWEAEEMGDAMKALENRTLDSKQEMDIVAALDEMKSMRARRAGVGTAEMLEALYKTRKQKQRGLAEEDEAVLRSVVFQNSSNFVRKLDEDDDIEHYCFEEEELKQQDRKRRKGEPLEENNDNKKNGALQAVNSLMKWNPEPGDKGHPPKLKSSGVEAPFAVSPKPLTFSVMAALERETEGEIISGKLNEGGDKMTQENVNGKTEVASSGLSTLGLAYDSDSD